MTSSWWVRRSRVRVGLLTAVALVVAAATLLISVILGVAQRGTLTGLREYLGGLDDSSVTLSFATSPGPDPAAQDAAGQAVIGGVLLDLPVQTWSRSISPQFTATAGLRTAGTTLRWGVYGGAAAHATLLSGRWPVAGRSDVVQAALPEAVAARWGVQTGARLTIGSTGGAGGPGATVALQVVGIFRPDTSGFWAASRALVPGSAVTDPAPVVQVAVEVLSGNFVSRSGGPLVGWTVVLDPSRLSTDRIAALRTAVDALPAAVRADPRVSVGGTLVSGGLPDSLVAVEAAVARSTAATPLPLTLIVMFCLVMLIQLGRLSTDERRSETVLLISRGLSARRALGWSVLETAVAALCGALVGLAVAAIRPGLSTAGLAAAAGAVIVAVVASAVPAYREAAAPLVRDRADDSGRARVLVAGGLVVLVVGAAAFAWWRFQRAPSTPSGSLEPAVLVAPAAILTAGGLVATVLFGAVVTALAAFLPPRDRGIGRSLVLRQMARRATVFAAAVLLLCLSIGGLVIAATYSGTVAELERTADRLRVGADVRVTGLPLDVTASDRGRLADADQLAGVRAATPVSSTDAGDADHPRTLIGVRADRLDTVTSAVDGFDPAVLGRALGGTRIAGPTIPTGATRLRISGRISSSDRSVAPISLAGWWMSTDDVLVRQDWGATPWGSVSREVAAPSPGARLLGVDVPIPRATAAATADVSLQVQAVDSAGHAAGDPVVATSSGPDRWRARQIGSPVKGDRLVVGGSSISFTVAARDPDTAISPGLLRLLPSSAPAADAEVPGVMTTSSAAASGVSVGDVITVDVPGAAVQVRVVALTAVLPGFGDGNVVVADLAALQQQVLIDAGFVLPPTSIWFGSSDPVRTASAGRAQFGGGVQISAVGGALGLTDPAIRAYWWGAAGASVLAVAALAVVAISLAHRRRAEVVVLAALGVPPRRQAVLRQRELIAAVLAGWLLGAVVAIITVRSVIPRLAIRAVVGGAEVEAPSPVLDVRTLAVVCGVQVIAVAVVVVVSGSRIRRAAATLDPRVVTP